ncbi:MAG: hypothetical protein IK017_09670 [Paludibacteraceae bacterium]|nr:hypothetical protein [Paludibacteraceae bacterium]
MRYILLIALLISSMAVSSQVDDCQRWKEYGMLCGKFSVSETKQVYFSKGNLQYQASTDTWRFAERQYDRILADNRFRSSSYSGWIDLFDWGHSGYGNLEPYLVKNAYSYSLSDLRFINYSELNPLPDDVREKGIAGTYYDWGMFNEIVNGGNEKGLWRTLTAEEWMYLVAKRPHAKELISLATVCDVEGMILLPDDFTMPSDIIFHPASDNIGYDENDIRYRYSYFNGSREDGNYEYQNNYNEHQWSILESLGALFLPGADGPFPNYFEIYSGWETYRKEDSEQRQTRSLYYWNRCLNGCYWTSSVAAANDENRNHDSSPVMFNFGVYYDQGLFLRDSKSLCSVRLAADVSSFPRKQKVIQKKTDDMKINGKLPGFFSVSESEQVQFSQGNLQYQPSSNVWRFATNQYDVSFYRKKEVVQDSSDFDGWLDAFAWGTSGFLSEMREGEKNLPYVGGYKTSSYFSPYSNNGPVWFMIGENDKYDWGIYNAISNGGNKTGLWRTLSVDEWMFLLAERPHATELRSRAMVCGVEGYMLLPDDFQLPDGLSFTPRSKDYTTNRYDLEEDWRKWEECGALFLPNQTKDGMGNGYWTTRGGLWYACRFYINDDLDISYRTPPGYLLYVRLVSVSSKAKVNKKQDVLSKRNNRTEQKKKVEVEGALPGLFSVSDSGQVRFSKGNLQYMESTDTWRFALNQYDVMQKSAKYCSSDDSIREPLTEWIDEFGWGSSGYDNRKPASRCNLSLQGPAAADPAGFSDSCYANYDWGVYNKIDNGGCEKGLWRTLSREEWLYILNERRNAENLRSRAVVCGVHGYMILPDDFVFPKDVRFIPQCHDFSNDYNEEQWRRMEAAGALFLPCYPVDLTICGGYWTSSSCLCHEAFYFGFEYNFLHKDYDGFDADGILMYMDIDLALSVRLVTDR